MARFVKYYTHLERAFSEIAPAFNDQGLPWGEWATDAYRNGESLTARIGIFGGEAPLLAKGVELFFEDYHVNEEKAVLSVSWTATGPTALFPQMDADLILEPLGPELTQLSLEGSYKPPLGAPGEVLDRLVLHRVAEASVKNLVDRISEALSA